jgi:hypothetical protein
MTALEQRVEKAEFLLRQSQLPNVPRAYRTVAPAVDQTVTHYNEASGSMAVSAGTSNPAVSQTNATPLEPRPQSDPEHDTPARSTRQLIPDQGGVVPTSHLRHEHLTPPNVQISIEEADDLDNPYELSAHNTTKSWSDQVGHAGVSWHISSQL